MIELSTSKKCVGQSREWLLICAARLGYYVKIILPILNTLTNKHTRSRKLVHDVPESQLLDVLSDYGILKDMLPTEMGGTVLLDQAEWIASRRAAELEEI